MSFENVEDIYPPSPMQEGMLYHSVAQPDGGVFVDQIVLRLEGELDLEAFRSAWATLVDRHATLRTAFLWDGLDEPLQIVRERVELPFAVEDWRQRSEQAREADFAALLEADRTRGFVLEEAPLLRHQLRRIADARWWWLFGFHHSILDGWSVRLLLRELWTVYGARRRGEEPRLAPALPFSRFIAWQMEQDKEGARAFWREHLRGFDRPTRIRLHADREPAADGPSGSPSSGPGAPELGPSMPIGRTHRQQSLHLDGETSRQLGAFARRHRITLGALFEGTWAFLLGALAREDEVVFGLGTAGRPPDLEGIEEAVGLFLETLPLRVRIDPEQPLAEWLRAVQSEQAAASRARACSLREIQSLSELPSGEPLFETLLVIENHPAELEPNPGGEEPGSISVLGMEFLEQSNYPLALLVVPGERLELIAVHEVARHDPAGASALLRRYANLLELFVDHGSTPVGRIPLVVGPEADRLVEWGEGEALAESSAEGLDGLLVHQRIRATAERSPETRAVVCAGQALAYAELLWRADRLALRLREVGVAPGVVVGIRLDRSIAMVVAVLAVLEAGGAYLPLDPAYPAEHLERVTDAAEARVLVVAKGDTAVPPGSDRHLVPIDAGGIAQEDRAGKPRETAARPQEPGREPEERDLAYVIYTSGSTGQAKGVAVGHGNLRASNNARDRVYGDRPARFLLLSSFAFDSSVAGLFHTLSTGGTLVLPLPGEEKDLRALEALIREHGVTRTLCLPSLHALFLDELSAESLASLESVIVAGEACPPSLVKKHVERLPGVRLRNEYGPTEGTVWCTVHEVPGTSAKATADPIAAVPIGRPIPGARIRLLDSERRPVPVGMVGEIWIGGAGVAKGYLHRPRATAERFVELAFEDRPPERFYRTGDLARWNPQGELEFLGRADGQVKVRGHRIETEGLAALLVARPEIREAVVRIDTRAAESSAARLVAHVVPAHPSPELEADPRPFVRRLTEGLASEMPAFLVPDAIFVLSELPRLPNGKVDRRALAEATAATGARTSGSIAEDGREAGSLGAIEQQIAEVWQELLGIDSVARQDHFFRLGGDSILGIRAVSRLRQAGLEVEPRQIASHPVLADLARALGEASASPRLVTEERGPTVGELPLLPIQRWFLERNLAAPQHWNLSALYQVSGRPDPEDLERAVAVLMEHHDLLRARFEQTEAGWRQIIEPPGGAPPVEHATYAAESELSAAIARAQASFELGSSPLVRFVLFRPAAGEGEERPARLLVAAHHLVVDVVSFFVLVEDLEKLLGDLAAGRSAVLPARTVSVAELASRLAAAAEPPASAAAPNRQIDARWVDLPFDHAPDGGVTVLATEADADTVRIRLDVDTTAHLLGHGSASMEDLLLTALAISLGRWRGHGRLWLHIEGHGRDVEGADGQPLDLSRTLGWLTTMKPLAVELTDEQLAARDPSAALSAVRQQRWRVSGAIAEAEPEVLFDFLGRQPGRAGASAAETAADGPTEGRVGLRWLSALHDSSRDPRNARSHLLELNAAIRDGALEVDWIYCRTHHRRATVERLGQGFVEVLEALAVPAGSVEAREHRPTEVQEALLSHHVRALHDASASDDGLLLLCTELRGPLDTERFERAFERTVDRYEALRSSIVWRDRPHPVQVVAREVDFPVEWHRSEGAHAVRADALADALRAEGLDPSTAPVGRVAVLRLADDHHLWLWLCHHLLLDGWSSLRVVREVLDRYRASEESPDGNLETGPRLAEISRWTRGPKAPAAADFWQRSGWQARSMLSVPRLPRLPLGSPRSADPDIGLLRRPLGIGSRDLASAARALGVTSGSLIFGTWGWVVGRASSTDRPTFAMVSSGRSAPAADLPGIETAVGMLANALPVRAEPLPTLEAGAYFEAVLRSLQEAQAFEHVPMARLFEAGGVALREMPCDSLVTYANFPLGSVERASEAADPNTLELVDFRGDLTSGFPLTVSVEPVLGDEEGLMIEMRFDSEVFERATVEALASALDALLSTLVGEASVSGRLGTLADLEAKSGLGALLAPLLSAGDSPAPVEPRERRSHPLGGTDVAAPETATEAQLMRIWNDLIAVQEYGVDENFFRLGGHSLLVASMIERVHLDFGVELPLGLVFQYPTVRSLAAAIDRAGEGGGVEERTSDWGHLVPIRVGGEQRPLFLVHGLGGEVGWFYALANYLDPELPLYGLQAAAEPHDDLGAMAESYIEALRARQGEGPYRIGGYCIGGGVAFEMARRLESAGLEVELLLLIDSVPQSHVDGRDVSASTQLARRLRHLFSKPPEQMVSSVGDAARRAVRGVARRFAAASTADSAQADDGAIRGSGGTLPELDDVLDMRTLPRVYHRAARRHFRAMRDYSPAPYGGDAWLFRTRDARFAEDFGWGQWVEGHLAIEKVPGQHVDVLKEPHVRVVGEKLATVLAGLRGSGEVER